MKPQSEIIKPESLNFIASTDVPGAQVASMDCGVCEVKIVKYPAGTQIPKHKHSGETLKAVLKGKLRFSDGDVPASVMYRCNGEFGYFGTAVEDTVVLVIQKPGTKVTKL